MRYSHLTPHQFGNFSKYVDTAYVTTYSTHPLDVAAPQASAQWTAEDITEQVVQRFSGRIAAVEFGAILECSELSPSLLANLEDRLKLRLRCGVLLTDRLLLTEHLEMTSDYGTPWIVLDWWQWLRNRVDETRLTDAWLFLAHAHRSYLGSREHRELGLDKGVSAEMTRQGQMLLMRLTEWNDSQIHTLWQRVPAQFQSDPPG